MSSIPNSLLLSSRLANLIPLKRHTSRFAICKAVESSKVDMPSTLVQRNKEDNCPDNKINHMGRSVAGHVSLGDYTTFTGGTKHNDIYTWWQKRLEIPCLTNGYGHNWKHLFFKHLTLWSLMMKDFKLGLKKPCDNSLCPREKIKNSRSSTSQM